MSVDPVRRSVFDHEATKLDDVLAGAELAVTGRARSFEGLTREDVDEARAEITWLRNFAASEGQGWYPGKHPFA